MIVYPKKGIPWAASLMVEQHTLNVMVVGSTPAERTDKFKICLCSLTDEQGAFNSKDLVQFQAGAQTKNQIT